MIILRLSLLCFFYPFISPVKIPFPTCSSRLLWLCASFLSFLWSNGILCIFSISANFQISCCTFQTPDLLVSAWLPHFRAMSKTKPKKWFETPISYQSLAQTGLESFVPSVVPLFFAMFEFHYLWLTYKSIEIPHESFYLRIINAFNKYWEWFWVFLRIP